MRLLGRAGSVALVGGLGLAHLVGLGLQLADLPKANVIALVAESVVFAGIAGLVLAGRVRFSLATVLAVAALLRLTVFLPPPYHSTDAYRYVWDGRVQAAGINPYRYLPSDPALASLRDGTIWPRINRADYAPTIYPPVAQALFYLSALLGGSVLAVKALLLCLEAAAIWGLTRLLALDHQPPERVLLYAWCPLPVWEFAGGAHIDAAMTGFVVLALLAVQVRREALAGLALALAVLTKFLPLVIAPALWRRWDLRLPAIVVGTIGLAYLPYLGAGPAVLGFLPGYAGEEGIRDGSGFWLLRVLRDATGFAIPTTAFVIAVAVALAGYALTRGDRAGGADPLTAATVLATAGIAALSPVYPWYFGWLIALFCLRPSLPVLWIAATAFLLYWADARQVLWLADVVYGGFFALCLAALVPPLRPAILVRRPA